MNCCATNSTAGTNACFSKWSKKYAKKFRKNGLEKAQLLLLEGLRMEPVRGKNILDIGCGVGSLHMTLLQEGAARATGVDVAEGMLEKARELSSEFGLNERVSYRHGDFVELADTLPDADITILDKVVCCYGDLDLLLETSVRKTTRIYGLTHPSDNFLVRGMFKLQIAILRLFRSKFRPFWHNWDLMHQKITQRGFRLVYEKPTFLWNIAVFQRI